MARLSPFLAGSLLVLLVLPGGLPAQPPETFSENLIVREREILIDLPESFDRLEPQGIRVLVDGTPREVTRAERAGGHALAIG